MEKYIELATINLVHIKNKFARRNRIVQKAVREYVKDPQNFKYIYSWYSRDIIKDETRARHYGVKIGTQIGWITSPKDKTYYNNIAKLTKQIKKMVIV